MALSRYQNGSILIATLLPQFTILHTLTTSRGPSPILSLAWHASSSKQKSDMLATQSSNGDLRVWSVAKPPGKESPRVIRVLKRSESTSADPKWMAWSKNGKVVQYLEGLVSDAHSPGNWWTQLTSFIEIQGNMGMGCPNQTCHVRTDSDNRRCARSGELRPHRDAFHNRPSWLSAAV